MPTLKNFTNVIGLSVLLMGTMASAEEVYPTATGEEVRVFEVFQDCDDCPEMIVLPMGQFQMGSSLDEAYAAHRRSFTNKNVDPDEAYEALRQFLIKIGKDPGEDPAQLVTFTNEAPAHKVTIDLPIAMGRNEVTREEWAACMDDNACTDLADGRVRLRLPNGPHPTDPRSPITGITYHEMRDYTAWLNDKIGANVYRLPTEAEWEYAARAGTTTAFAQGDTLTLDQANFLVSRREIRDGEYVWKYDLGSAHEILPVDRLDAANGWGLRHMSGNVSEFTSTCGYGPHRGLATSSQYLEVDSDRETCRRSIKGGMYTGNVELARPARRVAITDDYWSPSLGFRAVRNLERNLDIAN